MSRIRKREDDLAEEAKRRAVLSLGCLQKDWIGSDSKVFRRFPVLVSQRKIPSSFPKVTATLSWSRRRPDFILVMFFWKVTGISS